MPAPPAPSSYELNVGTIEYDGDSPGYAEGAEDSLQVAYGDFQMTNHYERDGLTYAGSNTSSTPFQGSCVSIIRLGAPRLLWACEWTASRLGADPQVPDPTNVPAGWTLLDIHLSASHVSKGPDGFSNVRRISGIYIYSKDKASDNVWDDVTYAKAPWVREGTFSRKVDADRLRGDLMTGTGRVSSYQPTNFAGTAGPGFAVAG